MAAKDYLEKQLLRYADVFADIWNVCVFNGEQRILPNELIDAVPASLYKSKKLRTRMQERDVAKHWDKCKVRIAFLGIENQTAVNNLMPLRIIGYDGAVYRDEINDYIEAQEANRKLRKRNKPANLNDKRLQIHPVITIVLYFDHTKMWTGPTSLRECFKDIPPELEPYVNDYKIRVIDVAWLPDETIAKFTSDFRFIAQYYSEMRKQQTWKPMPEHITHIRDLFELLKELTHDNRFIEMYRKYKKTGGDATMASIALDYLEQNGYDRGVKDGESKGRKDGEQSATIKSIRSVMRKMDYSAMQAMDMLDVPTNDRQTYISMM